MPSGTNSARVVKLPRFDALPGDDREEQADPIDPARMHWYNVARVLGQPGLAELGEL